MHTHTHTHAHTHTHMHTHTHTHTRTQTQVKSSKNAMHEYCKVEINELEQFFFFLNILGNIF